MNNLNETDRKSLSRIITILTAKFDIEYIFLNTYISADIPFYELIILISNQGIKTLGDLDPQITVALGEFHNFHHFSYMAHQVKEKLKTGSLFLFSSCHPQKLVYKKAKSRYELYPEDYCPSKSLEAVNGIFQREQHKIEEFKKGFQFYKERNNCEHAAFMLHQVIELSFRTIEILVVGKDRLTHSIRTHQQHLCRFAPIMSQIFNEKIKEDRNMLKRLDVIYRSTRYEDSFDVEMEELLQLEEKMNQVLSVAVVVYENFVADFEKEFVILNDENKVSINMYQDNSRGIKPINMLVKQITDHLDVQAIYLFGTRNHAYERKSLFQLEDKEYTNNYHFDVLLVCDNETKDQVYSLESSINQTAEYTVLFLPHAQDEIQKGLSENNRLFHDVLQRSEPIYVKQEENIKWIYHENHGKLHGIAEVNRKYGNWISRKQNANSFITALHGDIDSECVCVFMINQALEQGCLGLLQYYFDYKPARNSLAHLITLCYSFWEFPQIILKQRSKVEKELFRSLLDAVKDLRYKGRTALSYCEVSFLQDLCESFMQTANEMANKDYELLLEEQERTPNGVE